MKTDILFCPADIAYPELEDPAKRLVTFQMYKWDETKKPSVQQMLDSGFICTGVDTTCCYYCGHGFNSWKKSSNPFEDHKLFYFNCLLTKTFPPPQESEPKEVENMTVSQLKNEVTVLREKFLCKTCLINTSSFASITCGHQFCHQCVPKVKAKCSLCREIILAIVKLY